MYVKIKIKQYLLEEFFDRITVFGKVESINADYSKNMIKGKIVCHGSDCVYIAGASHLCPSSQSCYMQAIFCVCVNVCVT